MQTETHPSRRATQPTRQPIELVPYGAEWLRVEHAWDGPCHVFKTIMDALASVGFAGTIQWWTHTASNWDYTELHHLSVSDLSHPDKAVQFIDALLETSRRADLSGWQYDFREVYGQTIGLAVVEGAHLEYCDFTTTEGFPKRGWRLHLPNVRTYLANTEHRNMVPRTVEAYINPTANSEQVG